MKIYSIFDKKEYIKEYVTLCSKEWGSGLQSHIDNKVNKILNNLEDKIIDVLILLNENELIGFISLFKYDGEEEKHLTPWYATMYVKKEYRNKGYSKILNDAILERANELGFDKIYLKTDLENYYEKFGAKYIKKLNNGEKLYSIMTIIQK